MPGMRPKGERVRVLACRPGRLPRAPRPTASIHKRHCADLTRQRVARLPSAGVAALRRQRARPGPTLLCTGCNLRRGP
jgi:hypothetical protein